MLKIENISFSYDRLPILSNFNLQVDDHEIVALVGASGQGKSTLLRIICGLEKEQSGTITLNNQCISGDSYVPPNKRNVGLVFQDYALFPHLNVENNIGYASNDKTLVSQLIADFGLTGLEKVSISTLSGGQQQRVAIARSLAAKPKLLLLDEPFSNLDSDVKADIKNTMKAIFKKYDMTCIIVSHNELDYEGLATRTVIMQ